MGGYDKFIFLGEMLGYDELMNALVRAMSDTELEENCEYIARMYDIDFEEYEDE